MRSLSLSSDLLCSLEVLLLLSLKSSIRCLLLLLLLKADGGLRSLWLDRQEGIAELLLLVIAAKILTKLTLLLLLSNKWHWLSTMKVVQLLKVIRVEPHIPLSRVWVGLERLIRALRYGSHVDITILTLLRLTLPLLLLLEIVGVVSRHLVYRFVSLFLLYTKYK